MAEKRYIPGRCCQVRKGGIEPEPRHHDTDAVWTDDAQQMRLCRVEHGLLQGPALLAEFAETGGNNDGRLRTARSQLANQTGQCLGRRDDDGEIRRSWQACDIPINGQSVYRAVMRVDQHQLASKSRPPQIAQDNCAD